MSTQRHFFRCPDCLGVWSSEIEIKSTDDSGRPYRGPWGQFSDQRAAVAPVIAGGCPYECGATTAPEHLGRVNGIQRLQRLDGAKAECDASCTHARGCECECPCGGVNHGVGVLADIPVISDQGTPKARFRAAPKSKAQGVARASEWRAILAEVTTASAPLAARISALLDKKRLVRFLDAGDYRELVTLQRTVGAIRDLPKLRTHQGRMKAARELIEKCKPV